MTLSNGRGHKKELRIGVIVSLTGHLSWIGRCMKMAAELRAEIINQNNLLKGHPLKLVVCDDQSSPEQAAWAAERLVTFDRVAAIIGTSSQIISSAVAPVGNVCQVPTIITSGFDVNHDKDLYIFNTSHQAEMIIEHSFQYFQSLNISSIVLLMPINLLGELGSMWTEKLAKNYGIRVSGRENFNPDYPTVKEHVARLRDYDAQAIFAYVTGEPAARVAVAMADLHMNVPLLVSHGNANSGFLNAVKHLPVPILVPGGQTMSPEVISKDNPSKRVIAEFNEPHLRRFGQLADYCSAASSDAVGLVAEGFKSSQSFYGPELREAIEKMAHFEGMEGVYNFSPGNHYGRGSGRSVILQLKDGKWKCNGINHSHGLTSRIRLSRAVQVMERLNRSLPHYRLSPALFENSAFSIEAAEAGASQPFSHYYDLKHHLIGTLRMGNGEEVREMISRITGFLLCCHIGNLDILKAWVTELFVTLFQALPEERKTSDELCKTRVEAISKLGTAMNHQDLCLRFLTSTDELLKDLENQRRNLGHQVLIKVLTFIEQNFDTPLTVERLAREVCLSPSRLSHLIKERYNLTLGDYIVRTRIEKSKQMLSNTDMPISLIAQEVGCPDQSYFTKIFKKVEKCTPGKFRREVLKHPDPPEIP